MPDMPATSQTGKTAASTNSSTAAPKLKLVIRRLPPTLPEEIFWKSVQPWLGDITAGAGNGGVNGAGPSSSGSKVGWKKYVKGRAVDDTNQHRIFSRAYIQMKSADDIADFAKGYDGHVFRSKDGQEYQAVVEFAPAQKAPVIKAKAKVDARQGTIDNDADFLSFMAALNAPVTKPEPAAAEGRAEFPKSTPLLDHLRELRQAKRGFGPGLAMASSSDDISRADHNRTRKGKDLGRGRDSRNEGKGKGKGGAGGDGKKGGQGIGGKNGQQGGAGKVPGPQPLAKNREGVKIQVNNGRGNQPNAPAPPPPKMQILQRNANPSPLNPASSSSTPAPKPNSRPASPAQEPNNHKPTPKPPAQSSANNSNSNKGKGPAEGKGNQRQRPGGGMQGARNLLSAAISASTQQAGGGNRGGRAGSGGGSPHPGGAGAGGQARSGGAGPPSGPKADRPSGPGTAAEGSVGDGQSGGEEQKRKRTRGNRGGAGKKKANDAGGTAPEGGAGAARIDD